MVRTIVRLVVLALIVNAGMRVGPVFWTHFRFRDAVEDLALFSQKRTDREVSERIMDIAARMEVPMDRRQLKVHRAAGITYVDATYVAQLEYFPSRYYPWEFTVDIRATPPGRRLP